jgi:hypothetical protein
MITDTDVLVTFHPASLIAPGEHFVVGRGSGGSHDVTPTYVRALNTGRGSFFNTGMHVFRQWIVSFDAVRGKVGFLQIM